MNNKNIEKSKSNLDTILDMIRDRLEDKKYNLNLSERLFLEKIKIQLEDTFIILK